LRMAALMKLRVIYVFTHDSIGLGEDGPTHQAVEHAATLRLIPNMDVWRPADTVESLVAWAAAIERVDGPTSLLFSRQSLPFVSREVDVDAIRRGAYVIGEAAGGISEAQAVLIATGSEVGLAAQAQKSLAETGVSVRVVSMPSTTVFDRQTAQYKSQVLPEGVPRIAIEAGVTDFWWKYVRASGAVIGIDRFGESAPAKDVFEYFGFTVDNVVATVKKTISKGKSR
jgi:transketolase